MPRAATLTDWVALLALTIMWGTSFLFNELALRSFTPALIVLGRVLVGMVVLLLYLRLTRVRLATRPRRWWLRVVVMAMLGTVLPFHLIVWGQQSIDSALAGVLMAVMPLFVVALAHFFIPGSTLTAPRVLGFVFGFVGVVLVLGPQSITLSGDNAQLMGMLAVLGGTGCYALNAVYARRIPQDDPTATAAGMMVMAAIFALPAAGRDFPRLLEPLDSTAIGAVAILGLACTGIASVLYFRLIQGPGPAFLSLVNYFVPVWAVVAGAMVLGESLEPGAYGGLALILAGVAVSELGNRFRGTARHPVRTPVAAERSA